MPKLYIDEMSTVMLFANSWKSRITVGFLILSLAAGCIELGDAPPSGPQTALSSSLPATNQTSSSPGIATPKPAILRTPGNAQATKSYDRSVLTLSQRDRLYQASMQFVAHTQEDGIRIAQELNFAGANSHPSNMCGPLSMGILRDAGLSSRYVDLHEFWNMDPRPNHDQKLMELTFSPEEYLWYRSETPIDKFDFTEFPLFTGDFIYLFAGDAGTFEHILVVTRVDEAGRVFSTTNFRTGTDEYLIEELMLYDPSNPGAGMFYHWTDRKNAPTGITGFGGFQLWRRISPFLDPSEKEVKLAEALDDILLAAGGEWNVLIKEVGGPILYDRRANIRIHTASVAKVPIAMLFFFSLDQRDVDYSPEMLAGSGTQGRSFGQLLEAMLVRSEEEAADALEQWVNGWLVPTKVLTAWGFPEMSLTPRRSTAREMALLFEGLYLGKWIEPSGRQIILDYLAQYTPNDVTRLGLLLDRLPEGSTVYGKRGSLAKERVIVADVALVVVGERAFVLAFFGQPGEGQETTYEALDAAIGEAALAFWDIYKE